MRDAPAAIMSDEGEAGEAEARHFFDHVARHRALRIVDVIGTARWLAGIAVAAQIRRNDGVVPRKTRRHLAPCHMILWVAMQQQ